MRLTEADIQNTVARALGQNIAEPQFALLGNFATKQIKVAESDQEGLVWCHGLGDDKTSSFVAFKAIEFRNAFGRPVEIVKTKLGYKIVGLAPEDATFTANSETSSQFPVLREQLMFAGIVPTEPASGRVQLMRGIVRVDNQHYYINDMLSGNLIDGSTDDTSASAISLPTTSGLAKIVMIQVDPTTVAITYKQTSEFNASFTLAQITLPTIDSGNYLWGFVKLIKGITALTFENVINVPDVLTLFTGGGSTAGNIDITGTEGETLALTENVYQNPSDNEWYKIDTDATASVAIGARRGVVVNIDDAPTVTIRLQGTVDGYTGLTSGGSIYASGTAGGYTQTRPDITDGGGQVAICEMGYALSTTSVYVSPQPIVYAKRETLANNETLTIEHHSDAQTRTRQAQAYVASSTVGATITGASYGSANQDTDIGLQGATLSGDSLDTSATFSGGSSPIGDISGTEYGQAQSYLSINGGVLTQFTFDLDVFVGSVSGDIDWSIHLDDTGSPASSPITSGSHTPTASATNTVNLTDSEQVIIPASTTFWVVYKVVAQPNNSRYVIKRQASSSYAGGEQKQTTNGGSTWSSTSGDLVGTVQLSAITSYEKLGQEFQQTSGSSKSVGSIKLWLKKVGTPSDTLTLRVETSSAGDPSDTLANVNATADVSESSLSTSYGWVTFTFSTPFSIGSSTIYHLVLSTDRSQSDTDYVVWGADSSSPSYANGIMHSYASSAWSDISDTDGIFELFEAGTNYDELLSTGTVSGANAEVGVRFDDGSGGDGDTKTTFKNQTGAGADIVCEVVL